MRQAVTFFVLAAAFASAQDQRPTVRTRTAAVIIDATVVDNDGHPVTDLTRDDFEIKEEGKTQQVVSATLVRGGVPARIPGITGAPAAPAATAPSMQAGGAVRAGGPPIPTVTAILFDTLSADTRPFATRAAAEFVSTLATANEYAGLFQAGLALTTVQPFTHNTRISAPQSIASG